MKRILVVDDDPALRGLTCRHLETAGYSVDSAGDGAAAVKLLEQTPYALAITDIYMPDTDGIQLLLQARKRYAGMPWIAISGAAVTGGVDMLPAASALGAVAVFPKPYSRDELLAAVEACIGAP